mmetsp:Transcript_20321/g.61684  ORF Transcript_20321/g.61684 Transcript_20321/m.61684 type:complete len:360 (+) Transcript_20321:1813-2892(+)
MPSSSSRTSPAPLPQRAQFVRAFSSTAPSEAQEPLRGRAAVGGTMEGTRPLAAASSVRNCLAFSGRRARVAASKKRKARGSAAPMDQPVLAAEPKAPPPASRRLSGEPRDMVGQPRRSAELLSGAPGGARRDASSAMLLNWRKRRRSSGSSTETKREASTAAMAAMRHPEKQSPEPALAVPGLRFSSCALASGVLKAEPGRRLALRLRPLEESSLLPLASTAPSLERREDPLPGDGDSRCDARAPLVTSASSNCNKTFARPAPWPYAKRKMCCADARATTRRQQYSACASGVAQSGMGTFCVGCASRPSSSPLVAWNSGSRPAASPAAASASSAGASLAAGALTASLRAAASAGAATRA